MRQRMTSHQPRGVLQDAGTVAVLTPNQGKVQHQFAMVVAWLTWLNDWGKGCRVVYLPAIPTEEMPHG